MRSLIGYLGCGSVQTRSGGGAVDFKITHFGNLTSKLIPFIQKYPIVGAKGLDFAD
jgi:hypothetical protein